MSFENRVIDLISSSDSEDMETECVHPLSSKISASRFELPPDEKDSDDDIPPLFERLKKLKSIDLEARLKSLAHVLSNVSERTMVTSCRATSEMRRKPILSLELSSDDDNDDNYMTTCSSSPSSRLATTAFRQQSDAVTNVETLPDIMDSEVVGTEGCTSSQTTTSRQHEQQPHNARPRIDNKPAADRQREEKKRQREEAKSEKERQKLLKQIDRDQLKSSKPGECINYVKAILDVRLLELPEASNITSVLTEANIRYALEEQLVPYSVTWRREIVEKRLADNFQVEQSTSQVDENQALIMLTVEQLVEAVYQFTQKRVNGISCGQTLRGLVHQFKCLLPGKMLTIITSGMQEYFRRAFTLLANIVIFTRAETRKKNRAYRAKVTDGGTAIQKTTKRQKQGKLDEARIVSRIEVEEALVELQIEEPCNFRLLDSSSEIAQLIVTFTKSIAEAPFRRETSKSAFPFYANSDGGKPVKVDKDGHGLLLLWQRQIQQFNNVSADMAQAIISEYPSPLALFKVYEQCASRQECEQLLKDIVVRRGAGPLATTRKIGPELSRKVYLFMTSDDGDLILN